MISSRKHVAASLFLAFVVLALRPEASRGWGTLTGGSALTADERQRLQFLLNNYGVAPKVTPQELDGRLAAHPIHQFIVYEAWLLLKNDPAMSDGMGNFPTAEAINGWDGVDLCEKGVRSRAGTGLVPNTPPLVPPGAGKAGADAEFGVDAAGVLQLNSHYNVRAHYWNPWLDSGEAPKGAAANYSRLSARLIVDRGDAAHAAAYLAHYVSDALSAKHADAITLSTTDVEKLDAIATRWIAARVELTNWLASPILQEGVKVIEDAARANGMVGEAWLERIRKHLPYIGGSEMLERVDALLMNIAPSTLTTAVACYLHDLSARPNEKTIDQFYTYFDPFYFNGPIYQPINGQPSFQLCSALSEHMQWETNPKQAELAFATIQAQASVAADKRTPLLTGAPRTHYAEWKPVSGFGSLVPHAVAPAFRETLANMVRSCARTLHGDIDNNVDFSSDFRPFLDASIRCVFTAFRASVTGLRATGWARKVGPNGDLDIQLNVKNLADRPAKLIAARVGYLDKFTGKRVSRPGWETSLSKDVAALGASKVDVAFRVSDVPTELPVTDFFVDLRGLVADTPDRGWVRIALSETETRLVRNPDSETLTAAEGAPVDVVVVFDTTSSMQSALDAMRQNAIDAIKALRAKTDDIRLAVVTFRDLSEKEDRPHFVVKPFTKDLETQFGFLRGLRADGGGDTPEDQLEGVSRAIGLWEAEGADEDRVPAKIIIVVTDASGKEPDVSGNTFASIAKRAREVDPAHVYPIIVGNDTSALAFGEKIAALTDGQVLKAASGDEVAKVFMAASTSAVVAHSAEAKRGTGVRWTEVVVGAGGGLAVIGVLLGLLAWRRDQGRREAAHG